MYRHQILLQNKFHETYFCFVSLFDFGYLLNKLILFQYLPNGGI